MYSSHGTLCKKTGKYEAILRAIYYDTETTGVRVSEDRITEIAAYCPATDTSYSSLVNPGMPIPPDASKITGITDDMVQDAPSFKQVAEEFVKFCSGDVVLIAHNNDSFDKPLVKCEFERHGVELPDYKYIDTLKWSRKYRPDLPRHSLQHLREIHGIAANNAHRALDDVIMLHQVFSLMTDDLPINKVYELLQETPSSMTMPFGKYRGRGLKEVPKSYISWLMDNGALDKPENEQLKSALVELGIITS